MRLLLLIACVIALIANCKGQDTSLYTIVWSDKFNNNGVPDAANRAYENGFVRNEEDQWYQP